MIDVKEATRIAINYFSELVAPVQGLLLEEVELSPDDKFWEITLGYYPPPPPFSTLFPVSQDFKIEDRQYKELKIDTANGKVLSMKIRKV